MTAYISLVTLGVDDLSRATAFYETMGWTRSSASVEGTVAFMQGGAVVLALFGRADLEADACLPSTPAGGFGHVALAMNVESEDAVDERLATAAAAGASIPKPAERAEWGGRSGYFMDLDGHLWEVAYNPGFGLLPDGRVVLPE